MLHALLVLSLCASPSDRDVPHPADPAPPPAELDESSAGPDASTRASLRVGAGLAALAALTYGAIGVLSAEDEASRGLASAGGAITGAAAGLVLAALVGVALEAWDVDENPGRFAVLVITAVAATVGLGITGGYVGWEAARDPQARVGVHVALGASLGLSLAVPFGALVDGFEVLEEE